MAETRIKATPDQIRRLSDFQVAVGLSDWEVLHILNIGAPPGFSVRELLETQDYRPWVFAAAERLMTRALSTLSTTERVAEIAAQYSVAVSAKPMEWDQGVLLDVCNRIDGGGMLIGEIPVRNEVYWSVKDAGEVAIYRVLSAYVEGFWHARLERSAA